MESSNLLINQKLPADKSMVKMGILFLFVSLPFLIVASYFLFVYYFQPMNSLLTDKKESLVYNKQDEIIGGISIGAIGIFELVVGLLLFFRSRFPPAWYSKSSFILDPNVLSTINNSTVPVGVIKDISTPNGELDLFIYSDCCVVAGGSLGNALLFGASTGIGRIIGGIAATSLGKSLGDSYDDKRLAKERTLSAINLYKSSPRNSLIPFSQIKSVDLSDQY